MAVRASNAQTTVMTWAPAVSRAFFIAAVLSAGSAVSAAAQAPCLDRAALVRLDAEWERALLESNVDRLSALVAEDFIWVHNHASGTDTRAALLKRTSESAGATTNPTRSRVSSDVEARILGSTGVVTGFTVVDRGAGSTRYNFMRTYVEVSGRCLLLANHTMEVPAEGG